MIKPCLKLLIFFLINTSLCAQKRLPDVFIEDLQRQNISVAQTINSDGPTIISFWATWCKPCLRELQTINSELEAWTKATNVKLLAISTDDARTRMRVSALVKSKNWNFDVYIDSNGDLQRSMNILSIPHTLILNSSGEIIYQHSAYAIGDEKQYFEVLQSLK